MAKRLFILFFLLLNITLTHHCIAQESNSRSFGVAYYAAYGYQPGVLLKAEHLFNMKKAPAYGNEAAKTFPFIAVEVAGYAHSQNNAYLSLGVQGGWRRIGTRGKALSFFLSMGALRTQHLINSYTLSEDGALEDLGKTGSFSFLPGIGLGFGGNQGIKLKRGIRPYLNIRTQVQIPYAHRYLIHPMLEIGFFFGQNKEVQKQ